MLRQETLLKVEELVEEVLDDMDVYGGNSEISIDEGASYCYAEAYNNTTLYIDLDPMLEDIIENFEGGIDFDLDTDYVKGWIKDLGYKAYNNFDPEDYFNEIWTPGFSIGAFSFVEMLKEDDAQFKEVFG